MARANPVKSFWLNEFPVAEVKKFLQIDRDPDREFSYRTDEWFHRFKLHGELNRMPLKNPVPIRLDVGAIYDNVLDWKTPIRKELIFDVDLDAYNFLRMCDCVLTNICCERCWPIAVCAMRVLDYSLREFFGYEDIHFFFSGRRGFHCWVRDDDAMVLSTQERSVIWEYLNWNEKRDNGRGTLVPVEKRVYNKFMYPTFMKYLDHNPIWEKRNFQKDFELRDVVVPADVEDFQKKFYFLDQVGDHRLPALVARCFSLRMDKPVTTDLKHLIRCPWSRHEITGNQVLPIYLDQAENFLKTLN